MWAMMLADLRLWSPRRWLLATAVALTSIGGLILTAAMLPGVATPGAPWWTFAAVAAGGILLGLIVAGYIETPIGAEATMCDLRWPVLGLLGLYVASDATALVPTLSAEVRPVLALAAVAVLGWGLAERMRGERHALAAGRRRDAAPFGGTVPSGTDGRPDRAGDHDLAGEYNRAGELDRDGLACTTCRPLFPTRTHSHVDTSEGSTP
jgi:hypothetical protein